MLSFDKLCNQKKNFSRLTGTKLDEFREIIRKVRPKWEEIQRRKKVSERSSKLKTLEDEVLMKFEIQTDIKGKIIDISKSYNGKTHNFKIRKMSDHVPRDVLVLADSGYLGLQKLHTKTILPHKRRRKVLLTPEQKAYNKSLSFKRILVEHVFVQLKKFKILGSTYRNFRKKLHLRFNIIAGIYNLRFE